jgi:hypothetical protein
MQNFTRNKNLLANIAALKATYYAHKQIYHLFKVFSKSIIAPSKVKDCALGFTNCDLGDQMHKG